jgi:hypothetical protein
VRKRFTYLLVFLVLLAVVAAPDVVQAQPGERADASLLQVQLVAEGPDKSIFQLDFEPRVAGFTTISTDRLKPALSFARTSRAQTAVSPQGMRGLVRGVEFDQRGATLIVQFSAAAPAKVVTDPSGDKQLLVTVRVLSGREALPTTTISTPRRERRNPKRSSPCPARALSS